MNLCGGHTLAAICLSPLRTIGLAVTFPNRFSVKAVRIVEGFLEFLFATFGLGHLCRDACTALLGVWCRALGLGAVDDDTLACRGVWAVAVGMHVFLFDVQAPNGCHFAFAGNIDFGLVESNDFGNGWIAHWPRGGIDALDSTDISFLSFGHASRIRECHMPPLVPSNKTNRSVRRSIPSQMPVLHLQVD